LTPGRRSDISAGAAYLFVPSPKSLLAEAVLAKDPVWTAPELWISEFRNVLAMHLAEKAEAFVLPAENEPSSRQVLSLCHSTRLTAYDCEFVALAHSLDMILVTSGGAVLKAFPGLAVSPEEFAG
jgi:predicted nucleic acid-binding protein